MEIEKPITIIGAPRSGTTLLFSILSSHPDLWSLYRESEQVYEEHFSPEKFGWRRGNELRAEDISDEISECLRKEFYKKALNYQIIFPNSFSKVYTNRLWEGINRKIHETLLSQLLKPKKIRTIEKNPKNCLRIPFLNRVFPDCFFIFLTRDPRTNISSLIDGWRRDDRKYETYQVPGGIDIEGHNIIKWSFLLPEGWEQYSRGKRLADICAFQYRIANQKAMEDLRKIPLDRRITLRYEDVILCAQAKIKYLCDIIGLDYKGGLKKMTEKLPPVNTSSLPNANKWKRNEREIMSIIDSVKDIAHALGYAI